MSTDEEVGERRFWRFGCGLFAPVLQIASVGPGTAGAGGGREIENDDAQSFEAFRYRVGREISDAQLGEDHRVDGDSLSQEAIADEMGGPRMQASGGIECVDEHVGVQKDHGSRVRTRSCSQFILGVRAAEASKASISAGVGFGFLEAGMTLASS